MPDELIIDEPHVLMVAIERIPGYRPHGQRTRNCSARIACRELCQVYDVEQTGTGLYKVGFHVLEEDEVVWENSGGEFRDGFWTGIEPDEDLGIDGELVISGYLQAYRNPLDDEIRNFYAGQQMPAQPERLAALSFTGTV